MVIDVSDKISNLNDQIANAAKILGNSDDRKKVFSAIYQGNKKLKTKQEIARTTGLSEIRVLQEGAKLAAHHLIVREKVNGEMAYGKLPFFSHHKEKILSLSNSKNRLAKFPTKVNPTRSQAAIQIKFSYPKRLFEVAQITIDDIGSFEKVNNVRVNKQCPPVDEKKFKNGIKRIIGEMGDFTDWGGEKNDLFTTRIKLKGKRVACAFAFKGKGTRGILKLRMMGKNGDQILRLFQCDANVYVLQYWGQIDQSIYEEMRNMAINKSVMSNKKIYYCVIDGTDTARLLKAYSSSF